jgi:hypothetical protein
MLFVNLSILNMNCKSLIFTALTIVLLIIDHIYREIDYCENVCISVNIQTDQKLYFKISKF